MADLPDPESLRDALSRVCPPDEGLDGGVFLGGSTCHMDPQPLTRIYGSDHRTIRGGKSWALLLDFMRTDPSVALLPQPVVGVEPDPDWARIVRERLDMDSKGED